MFRAPANIQKIIMAFVNKFLSGEAKVLEINPKLPAKISTMAKILVSFIS